MLESHVTSFIIINIIIIYFVNFYANSLSENHAVGYASKSPSSNIEIIVLSASPCQYFTTHGSL